MDDVGKGLEITLSAPPLRLSYLRGVAQGYVWLGFGYLQG